MIKITNGTNTMDVTTGLYNGLYSKLGYKPVGAKPEKIVETVKKEEVVVTHSNSKPSNGTTSGKK